MKDNLLHKQLELAYENMLALAKENQLDSLESSIQKEDEMLYLKLEVGLKIHKPTRIVATPIKADEIIVRKMTETMPEVMNTPYTFNKTDVDKITTATYENSQKEVDLDDTM